MFQILSTLGVVVYDFAKQGCQRHTLIVVGFSLEITFFFQAVFIFVLQL